MIVVLGALAIPALCLLGCLGLPILGAVLPGASPTP